MNSSSFIKILRSLSPEENKKFEELICSPYFNKNSNVIKLFKYLNKFSPEFKSEKLKKEFIWTELFGDRKFNYGVMKNMIYELNKLSDKFLTLEYFEKRELHQSLYLVQSLFDKGLIAEFEGGIQSLRKKISKMKLNTEVFYYNFIIEKLEQQNLDIHHKTKDKRYGDFSFFNKNLISYFFSLFFQIHYKSLIQSGMYKINIERDDLKKVLTFFEKEYLGNDILTMYQYYSIKLFLNDKNEKLYFEFKDFVFKNFEEFDRQTKYNSCTILLRSCSDFSVTDDTRFAQETFEIIKFMFKEKIYNNGLHLFIDHTLFYMAVDIAANFNETQWCENFIEEYKDRLNPSVKENYVNLGMMLLRRSQKNYNESLRYLSEIKPDNPLQKLTVKEFELKNFYDLGYFDDILSLIKNNKSFLVHDKTYSKSVRESVSNLMTYLKKILDIKLDPDNKKRNLLSLESISKEINGKDVFNKNWLLNILNETTLQLKVKS